jgi:hypothetical protein
LQRRVDEGVTRCDPFPLRLHAQVTQRLSTSFSKASTTSWCWHALFVMNAAVGSRFCLASAGQMHLTIYFLKSLGG